jgi:O-antigen ligase
MTSADVLGWLILTAIFVPLAMGIALLGLLQYRLAERVSPQARVAVALVLMGLGATLSVALTSRNLNESALHIGAVVLYEDYAGGFAASRWLSLLLLGAAGVEIVRGWLRARQSTVPDPAWPLLVGLLGFYAGTLLIQGLFSEHPGFSYKDLYVPVLLLAAYHQRPADLHLILRTAKWTVLALLLGSLLAMLVRPDFVLHRPAPGIIPGIDWRLFGLTGHANTLGPVALLGLLLELYAPTRRRWLHGLNIAVAVAVLVLAQSRTAWVAALLMLLFVWLPLRLGSHTGPASNARQFRRAVWTVVAGLLLLIAAAFVLVALGGGEYLQRKTDLGTLNGRFQIWDITLEAWRENPGFGYGPEVWGLERRQQFRLFHVGQAHNQFVQTLGEAGLAGLALLMFYVAALLTAALRRFTASRGMVLALLLLLLVRFVTEAPMRAEGLLAWPTFLHVLLLLLACFHVRQREVRTAAVRHVSTSLGPLVT